MTIYDALCELREAGVPGPYIERMTRYDCDNIGRPEQSWDICSLGFDNYCVTVLGSGSTIAEAMRDWRLGRPSVRKTLKSNRSL